MSAPNTALAKIDPRQASLKTLFEGSRPAISQVLPKHLTADRILKVTLAATSRTPKLLECTQSSILQSVMQAAQLGLEPGSPLGHAYLVPYYNKPKDQPGRMECQLIVGYRGLIDLARRSGQIDSIEARAVYEHDKFKVSYGLVQVLEHEPFLDGDPGQLVAVYALARIKSGLPQIEVMTRTQVDGIKAKSKASQYGPWVDHFDEMARKTVVRRLCKYLPLTVELADALEADERRETELDAGAFSTIAVESEEAPAPNPLTEKLAPAAAKAKARAAKEETPASIPDANPAPLDLLQWEAPMSEAENQVQLESAHAIVRAKFPDHNSPERKHLDRIYMKVIERLRGQS